MNPKSSSSANTIQVLMLVFGAMTVLFIWALFFVNLGSARSETLAARQAEHRNLALIISESLKQMTDRARALASLVYEEPGHEVDHYDRLLTLLAEDPVFNRLTIYNADGTLRYASHPDSSPVMRQAWLDQLSGHQNQYGSAPVLPLKGAVAENQEPVWRLPFVVPTGLPGLRDRQKLILVELDIGYLAGLLRHLELGERGFIQILDGRGGEWMRADTRGVIVSGLSVPLGKPALNGLIGNGHRVFQAGGETYQQVLVSREAHGFVISINQPHSEILARLQVAQGKQLIINLLMTIVVGAFVLWVSRGLRRQHVVLRALQLSEFRNRQLIERLEGEHASSSRAAAIDHLSGLFNRRQFLDVAPESLAEQRRKRRHAALLFIDLDRFKSINDTLGHHVGDLLLQAVAGRIRRLLGPDDLAARFGGDEFVVMLAGDRSEQDIEQWAAGMTSHLSTPYKLEGTEISCSPSVGIAICPRDGQDIEALMRGADTAMYSAKKAGRGQYRFFDQSLNVSHVEEFHLEQSFSEALRNREFILHYQPQVCLDTMEVVGYEALVRWQNPKFGLLFPDRFIPMAENTGFVIPLGIEVIRLACAQIVEWQQQCVPVQSVAVNVSPIQLAQAEFCRQVLEIVSDHGLERSQLELEITETAMLDAEAVENLHCLKRAGIRLSLDDFGTGYSGFAHLESVPVDKLKIDRSLISRICNSHDDSPVVSSTIILAKRMNLEVVAEGVETREQLVHLKVAGCDIAQGYHISRPVPPEQIPEFLLGYNKLGEAV
jgi:diguanylate cyclase (GGDEF)-like protein